MSKGTKQLPMGPEFVDACLEDFLKVYGGTESHPNTTTAAHLVGFAWKWARDRGVRGWSEVELGRVNDPMMQDKENIAHNMEEQKDG